MSASLSYRLRLHRSYCAKKPKPWYIKPKRTRYKILGICSQCGKIMESYWRSKDAKRRFEEARNRNRDKDKPSDPAG